MFPDILQLLQAPVFTPLVAHIWQLADKVTQLKWNPSIAYTIFAQTAMKNFYCFSVFSLSNLELLMPTKKKNHASQIFARVRTRRYQARANVSTTREERR